MRALTMAMVIAACAAGPAHAAVTASEVTGSDVATFDYVNRTTTIGGAWSSTVDPASSRTISGTATGVAGDPVAVRCLNRDGQAMFTVGETTLGADGAWSVTGPVDNSWYPCALRALPTGAVPADLTPFEPGATIYAGEVNTYNTAAGKMSEFFVAEPRASGYADFDSLASCGLCDMAWRDADGNLSSMLFFWNASVGYEYFYDSDGAGVGLSAERLPQGTVDGQRAYAPDSVPFDAKTSPGFVGIEFAHTFDPVSGDSTITATEALMTCPGAGTNPCVEHGLVDTGIRVERTMRYGDQGRVVRIVDVVRNTAGEERALALGFMNSQRRTGVVGTGVRLPGEANFSVRRNATVDMPGADASTVAVKAANELPVESLTNPVGTISASPPADGVVFTQDEVRFLLRYTFDLAPGATKTIKQTYAMAGTLADTEALAATLEDELVAPQLAFTAPADAALVDSAEVVASGTAADNHGVSSLTVNGNPVTLAGGTWSTALTLVPGANTITAVAKDAAGNEVSVTRTVTYQPPLPPAESEAPSTDAPPTEAPPPAAPPVVTPPAIAGPAEVSRAGARRLSGRGRRLFFRPGYAIACPVLGPECRAAITLRAALPRTRASASREVTIASRSLTISPGGTTRIRVKLSRAATRALRRGATLEVTLRIVSRRGAGAPVTVKRTQRLRLPQSNLP